MEESDNQIKANPPATKAKVAVLCEKLDDIEDRIRRNNLRFVGFPEGCESCDPVMFLENVLPEMLDIPTPLKGWFIECAHRLGPRILEDKRLDTDCEIHTVRGQRPYFTLIPGERRTQMERKTNHDFS